MTTKKATSILAILSLSLLMSCGGKEKADAYGNFEAVEYLISAEGNGKIMQLQLEEGQLLQGGDTLGYIDTTQLHLQKEQLQAAIRAIMAKMPDIPTQVNVLNEQLISAEREKRRVETLLKSDAATSKQLDDVNTQVQVIEKQIAAIRSSLSIQQRGLLAEVDPQREQIRRIDDQLAKSIIINPVKGTVLSKFVEQYEMAAAGKPLYKIANMETMTLKAYISGEQLSQVKVGQTVKVLIDAPDNGYKEYEGQLSWVAGKAEFTPKIIQTKNERTNLVYAVKILVKNDGAIKIGMPAEVVF